MHIPPAKKDARAYCPDKLEKSNFLPNKADYLVTEWGSHLLKKIKNKIF
jgi:hypothetical protein